jgi:hypothetical protein
VIEGETTRRHSLEHWYWCLLDVVNRARHCIAIDSSKPPNLDFEFLAVATVGIHERERSESFGGPPGSRSRHLESVSKKSRDVRQGPDLLAVRNAMSANVH